MSSYIRMRAHAVVDGVVKLFRAGVPLTLFISRATQGRLMYINVFLRVIENVCLIVIHKVGRALAIPLVLWMFIRWPGFSVSLSFRKQPPSPFLFLPFMSFVSWKARYALTTVPVLRTSLGGCNHLSSGDPYARWSPPNMKPEAFSSVAGLLTPVSLDAYLHFFNVWKTEAPDSKLARRRLLYPIL